MDSAFFFRWHRLDFERYHRDRENPESSRIFGNIICSLLGGYSCPVFEDLLAVVGNI